mmetsp:Transcript_61073/g.131786  ORF Transcript_61073/g.131786 Transcript_61073/m.131786 type:complete len:455 (-) Transcript_61073:74-1438(-)
MTGPGASAPTASRAARNQYLAALAASGPMFVDGAQLTTLAGLIQSVSGKEISHTIKGLWMGSMYMGVILSMLVSGVVADRYGRRKPLVASLGLTLVASVLCALVEDVKTELYVMMGLRALLGFCLGMGIPAAYTLVLESAETVSSRAVMVTVADFLFSVGQMWGAVGIVILNPYLESVGLGQRALIGLWPVLPTAAFFAFAALGVPESPLWLQAQGLVPNPRHPPQDPWSVLWAPAMRMTVLAVTCLVFAASFLDFGFSYAIPDLLRHVEGETGQKPGLQLVIISALGLVGSGLQLLLVTRVNIGHRESMSALGMGLAGLVSLMFGIERYPYVAVAAAYFVQLVANTLRGLMHIYSLEVFPTVCRATGMSMGSFAGRFAAMSVPIIFEMLSHYEVTLTPMIAPIHYAVYQSFFVVMLAFCLGASLVARYLPFETKFTPLNDDASEVTPLVGCRA